MFSWRKMFIPTGILLVICLSRLATSTDLDSNDRHKISGQSHESLLERSKAVPADWRPADGRESQSYSDTGSNSETKPANVKLFSWTDAKLDGASLAKRASSSGKPFRV